MQVRRLSIAALALAFLPSCDSDDPAAPNFGPIRVETLTTGYDVPDAIAVISEDEFLFAERSGALYHYDRGQVTEIRDIPQSVMADGYGGLLDVSLHPVYATNRLVYIAYNDTGFDLSVARFELMGDRAANVEVIYRANSFSIGSRIVWEDSSHFFLSLGIGGSPYPDAGPQDLGLDVGKIHRLTAEGSVPANNPILPGATAPTTVWSYGHRNPQGLVYDAAQGRLVANEHGPLGGDELNTVTAGANYGWPLFSYGLNYDGTGVSNMTETEAAGVSVLPDKAWGPNSRVAPSGLLLSQSPLFPTWRRSFLMGAMYRQDLIRYDPITDETETVLDRVGRVRSIASLPGGQLLISVDAGSPNARDRGRILRLSPADGVG